MAMMMDILDLNGENVARRNKKRRRKGTFLYADEHGEQKVPPPTMSSWYCSVDSPEHMTYLKKTQTESLSTTSKSTELGPLPLGTVRFVVAADIS